MDDMASLSVATLHDEFGFGTQRCDRFIKRFNKKAECIMDDMASLSVATLHDEFGFGTQRCDRFIKRFNKKAECIMDDMASWNDYIKTIKEELGIELGIRENK